MAFHFLDIMTQNEIRKTDKHHTTNHTFEIIMQKVVNWVGDVMEK